MRDGIIEPALNARPDLLFDAGLEIFGSYLAGLPSNGTPISVIRG